MRFTLPHGNEFLKNEFSSTSTLFCKIYFNYVIISFFLLILTNLLKKPLSCVFGMAHVKFFFHFYVLLSPKFNSPLKQILLTLIFFQLYT
jgi:hypothetical protein